MKNITSISAKTKKLHTPSDLSEKARQSVTAAINPLVADAFALYVKSKKFPLAYVWQPFS